MQLPESFFPLRAVWTTSNKVMMVTDCNVSSSYCNGWPFKVLKFKLWFMQNAFSSRWTGENILESEVRQLCGEQNTPTLLAWGQICQCLHMHVSHSELLRVTWCDKKHAKENLAYSTRIKVVEKHDYHVYMSAAETRLLGHEHNMQVSVCLSTRVDVHDINPSLGVSRDVPVSTKFKSKLWIKLKINTQYNSEK